MKKKSGGLVGGRGSWSGGGIGWGSFPWGPVGCIINKTLNYLEKAELHKMLSFFKKLILANSFGHSTQKRQK